MEVYNFFGLDESISTLNDPNGFRGIYYARSGEIVPDTTKKIFKKSHPKKLMWCAGICARGKTRMYFVSQNVKVDRKFFIKKILKL